MVPGRSWTSSGRRCRRSTPEYLERLDAAFASVDAVMDRYRDGDGFQPFSAITPDDLTALQSALAGLAEVLSRLAGHPWPGGLRRRVHAHDRPATPEPPPLPGVDAPPRAHGAVIGTVGGGVLAGAGILPATGRGRGSRRCHRPGVPVIIPFEGIHQAGIDRPGIAQPNADPGRVRRGGHGPRRPAAAVRGAHPAHPRPDRGDAAATHRRRVPATRERANDMTPPSAPPIRRRRIPRAPR